ncbi:MAG: LuxR C-terminal-related transcriptional regulator [Chloroflexota bacterium]
MSDLSNILAGDFKEREIEILKLMAAGSTNAAIGERLFITKETVRWYNKQIYSKLGTSRRTEAIAKARRLGLIGREGKTAVSPTINTPKHNLPTIATPFLGRDREIKRLGDLLTQSHTPLVTLLAPGGMGKTRLAIEAGHQLLDKFSNGVYLFELAAVTRAEAIINNVLEALRLTPKRNQSAKEVLFEYCRGKKLLLIFDNFEQLLEGAVLLDELIQTAPNVRVLATSRERLNLYGETIYRLSGLQRDGGTLFVASAKMLDPDFELSAGEETAVNCISELVGGMPLALILAASWVEDLTVAEIAEEIAQDLDVLSTDMRNVPERQRSMRTILAASWQQLSPQEQTVCMRLAVFKGGFSRAAATKITELSLPLLQKLRHKSFIQRVSERRYDMHPLVQQFVREKLEASLQFDGVQRRHLHYFQTHIAEIMAAFAYGDILHPLNQVGLEHENVRAALNWGLERDDAPEAVDLTEAMFPFWDNRSYTDEAIYYLGLALNHTPKSEQWATMNLQFCRFLDKAEQHQRGVLIVRDVLHFAEETQQVLLQLRAWQRFASILHKQAKFEEMIAVAEKYAALSRATGQRKHLIEALSFLATAHGYLSHYEAQKEALSQAILLSRESEDDILVARLTYNLALAYIWHLNQPEAAIPLLEESLSLKRLIGDRGGASSRLAVLARLAAANGRFAQANTYLEEAQAIAQEVNSPKRLLTVHLAYTVLYEMQERWTEAVRAAKTVLQLGREYHRQIYIIVANAYLTYYYLRLNLNQQARHHLIQAIEMALALSARDHYGELLLALSDYFQACRAYEKSANLFFIYLGNGQIDIEAEKKIAHMQTALQPHFSANEWARMEQETAVSAIEPLLHTLLSELKNQ